MKPFFVIAYLLLCLLLLGCVPKKKWVAQVNENIRLEQQQQRLMRQLEMTQQQQKQLVTDTLRLTASLRTKDSLIAIQNQSLEQLTKDLEIATIEIIAKETKINEQNRNLSQQQKTVNNLQLKVQQQQNQMSNIRQKVDQAMPKLKLEGMTVQVKEGKVRVLLPDAMLFQTASATIEPAGREALRKLADVLKNYKDFDIYVEGHTDNVPVTNDELAFKDNWDLSALRAAAVVKILQEYNISGKKLIAAGRGEFNPVAANDSPENRSKNRRTEIILAPKLDDMLKILEK
ncbi:MAG: OmpA family protein [Bernardetiaceae bacterium]|nr:OmpA family protein [Bernardetiaceae bacterium]